MIAIKSGSNLHKRQQGIMIITFLAPALLLYITFFIYPSIKAFYVSLFDWSGFTKEMDYIGLKNFVELFQDKRFWNVAVMNTLGIIFIGGFMIFSFSFFLSGVLTTRLRGRNFLRGVVFLPTVINPVAIGILWAFIYNRQWGLLNNILKAIGLGFLQQTWTGPQNLFGAILVALVWAFTGFYCILFLAALDRIPAEYLECADLEGASEIVKFFKIKIPLIWGVVVTSIIFWGITAIKEFALLFVWGGGIDIPPEGATNIAVAMFISAFGKRITIYRMGYSTAMGVIMFLFVLILVLVISKVFKKEEIEY